MGRERSLHNDLDSTTPDQRYFILVTFNMYVRTIKDKLSTKFGEVTKRRC